MLFFIILFYDFGIFEIINDATHVIKLFTNFVLYERGSLSAYFHALDSSAYTITISATVGEEIVLVFDNGYSGSYGDTGFHIEGATRLGDDGGTGVGGHLGYIKMRATSTTVTMTSLWSGLAWVVVKQP